MEKEVIRVVGQEKREVENGLPRDTPCRAEDGTLGQRGSERPSLENGFLVASREEPDSQGKDDSLATPHKKRGRRKLERPTKCELLVPFSWLCYLLFPLFKQVNLSYSE